MIEIFNIDDSRWNSTLSNFDSLSKQLHFTSNYHKLFQKKDFQDPLLFVYRQNRNIFFYPFIRRKIDQNYSDVTSVFGYTGPITNTKDEIFIKEAHNQLLEYLKNKNVISEFIRFNPFLDNHLLFIDNNMKLTELKPYVIIDLTKEIDVLFSEIHSGLRAKLRNAENKFKNKITVTKDANKLYSFFDLYKKHMKRLDVNNYYLFSDEYYKNLANLVLDNGFLMYVKLNNKISAGHIFLKYGAISYSHHAVRNSDEKDSSLINKLLYWEAFKYLKANGFDLCLLGGGVTNEYNDQLLGFKMSFGGYTKSLWLGKRILDEEMHLFFCNEWAKKYPHLVEKYEHYIDKYHFTE